MQNKIPHFPKTYPARALGLLFLALAIACGFEFVNGFHDTANAVATVIYTKALKPWRAVIWSGVCNLCGVYLGGIGVAFTIVHLLPVDLLVNIETGSGLAMVLALLLAAILWNLGTWYRGLPASSSHTLIGAILGVGLANSLLSGRPFEGGVNWHIAGEVGLSLLISPLVGFGLAALLLVLSKAVLHEPHLYEPPQGDTPPPAWIRSLLILTCTGVSFAHGSNDGQKGIGLIMLILIGLLPGPYALNLSHDRTWIDQTVQAVSQVEDLLYSRTGQAAATAGRAEGPIGSVAGQAKGSPTAALQRSTLQVSDRIPTRGGVADLPDPIRRRVSGATTAALQRELAEARALLTGKSSLSVISKEQRWQVRTDLLEADAAVEELERSGTMTLTAADRANDWVEADRRHGGRKDRQDPSELRARGSRRAGRYGHDWYGGSPGDAGQHYARPVVGRGGDDDGQPLWTATPHPEGDRAGLGPDSSCSHVAIGKPLRVASPVLAIAWSRWRSRLQLRPRELLPRSLRICPLEPPRDWVGTERTRK